MPTFVALLRGVNVGKAKRVPMAELRTLLSPAGLHTAWLRCSTAATPCSTLHGARRQSIRQT